VGKLLKKCLITKKSEGYIFFILPYPKLCEHEKLNEREDRSGVLLLKYNLHSYKFGATRTEYFSQFLIGQVSFN